MLEFALALSLPIVFILAAVFVFMLFLRATFGAFTGNSTGDGDSVNVRHITEVSGTGKTGVRAAEKFWSNE